MLTPLSHWHFNNVQNSITSTIHAGNEQQNLIRSDMDIKGREWLVMFVVREFLKMTNNVNFRSHLNATSLFKYSIRCETVIRKCLRKVPWFPSIQWKQSPSHLKCYQSQNVKFCYINHEILMSSLRVNHLCTLEYYSYMLYTSLISKPFLIIF